MCICANMCVCVCVCLCVWLTQLNYKRITYLNVFLFVNGNGRSLWDWKKSQSQCILKKWMSTRPIHVVAFDSRWWMRKMSHWRESVYPLRRICIKRGRVFEDNVFIKNTCLGSGSKRRREFTRGRSSMQVTRFSWPVVSRDRYMCASAIFVVGTSGIPPKFNYRSAKSYKPTDRALCLDRGYTLTLRKEVKIKIDQETR